ncbi:unnamed protein product [Ectocarpus sp. CCAP 1310/34]|nr:unnamed protein product [Ectocarpus sp. CCAP 1310/34]
MEEQQEMAANAREVVLSKLQDTLRVRMEQRRKEGAGGGATGARLLSRVIDELFEEWDKDGNNLITREELTRGLNKLGIYLSATRELFRLADPDHSKSIDPAEFRAFLSDLQTLADEPELLSRQAMPTVQLTSKAEEREHPRVDDCGLLAACAAASSGGGGGGGGDSRRVGEARRAASMSSVV